MNKGDADIADPSTFGLIAHFLHHWQSAVGSGADHQLAALPGNVFLDGKRRVAELVAEFLGGLFLAFPNVAAINHDILVVCVAIEMDRAESKSAIAVRFEESLALVIRRVNS